ncbi:hypothetical protein KCU88_g2977, partial [Aureobasidium melanogenum]
MTIEDLITDPALQTLRYTSEATLAQTLSVLSWVEDHASTPTPSLDLKLGLAQQQKILNAYLAKLRGLHRQAAFGVRATKQETAEARQEVDRLLLQLQNLYYEQRHLMGEIGACEGYDHAYMHLPIRPLDEYLALFPEHADLPEQELMPKRIEYERKEREKMEQERLELVKIKDGLVRENTRKKDELKKIDEKLEAMIDGFKSVEEALQKDLYSTLGNDGFRAVPGQQFAVQEPKYDMMDSEMDPKSITVNTKQLHEVQAPIKQPTTFLDLPFIARQSIYRYLLPAAANTSYTVCYAYDHGWDKRMQWRYGFYSPPPYSTCPVYCNKQCPAILLVSRAIHNECRQVLYNTTQFSFCSAHCLRLFSQGLNKDHVAVVNKLSCNSEDLEWLDEPRDFTFVRGTIVDIRDIICDTYGGMKWEPRVAASKDKSQRGMTFTVSYSKCAEAGAMTPVSIQFEDPRIVHGGVELGTMPDTEDFEQQWDIVCRWLEVDLDTGEGFDQEWEGFRRLAKAVLGVDVGEDTPRHFWEGRISRYQDFRSMLREEYGIRPNCTIGEGLAEVGFTYAPLLKLLDLDYGYSKQDLVEAGRPTESYLSTGPLHHAVQDTNTDGS